MFEFAERVRWKLYKRDKELIIEFCSKIEVEKRALKVWMQHKKKNSTTMRRANGRKQLRTKFTQHHTERMFEFAQKVGLKLQKRDEELISKFCSKTGVKKIFKEAAQMSILSKIWLQAWSTLPNLDFKVDYTKGKMKIVDNIMERYRDAKIPIEKFELSNSRSSGEVFPLINTWLDIALQNDVKNLVFRGLVFTLYPLTILKILATKSLRELVLWACNLKCVSVSSGVANCDSLRKLSLLSVSLDENMLQTLLNSCPLMVSFIIKDCRELEKIELLNLQKIKLVSISKSRNQRVKIQTPTLEHLSYSGYLSDELDVIECQNLKYLDLLDISYMWTSDGFLQYLISRFQSLKVLKIQYCWGIREIYSPNLVSLEYKRNEIPKLKIARESSQLKHSKIVLHCEDNLNAAWFSKLSKFLSDSTTWSQVSLDFSECNEINMRYLELHHRVPSAQIDVLNLEIRSSLECPTFVDARRGRKFNFY
ncbi:hypothetical protein RND71_012648 [Anisodus tanguticus]|uniref:At1g61320/AtMIF1 LRR domain-containing protein n=1 Tax=Anisodus tanguticus TaxID=243964 RepID=A0AAE1SHG4_9SOLA|nr:hypothetical protein RND71_012648 [Anisodus tanguticus]